ncbi:MAG: bifunctional DNA-formamidopyrimidine glycosylase/DNA-(apurinic or apyrimidinic site) lyase [Alphaproteobacteria bacterium]
MPELPEVETVRRGLAPILEGHRLVQVDVRRPDLRRPFPPGFRQHLTGRRILALDRRGKYLIARLDDGHALIIHLGMSGRLVVARKGEPPPGPHDHVILTTDAGARVRFHDPRRFGLMDLCPTEALDTHPQLRGLGVDPLAREFSGPVLATLLAGRRLPVKNALMDQRLIAGVGNIYACEALFRAGISPRRPAARISGAVADRLAAAVKRVLTDAIKAGGSSLRDHVQPNGELGYFQHQWAVYGREGEPCPGCTCRTGIKRIVQGGRSTFYCLHRQR